MTAQILQFRPRPAATQQGLADLYRVEDAVMRSGIPLMAEHGVSEEGDPWVAFYAPDTGDVVAHVARVDGRLVADSPAFARPLWTRDVSALLDKLLRRLPRVVDQYVLAGAAVALAAMHLSDADAAGWLPFDLHGAAGLAESIGTIQAIAVATAVHAVLDLPDALLQALGSTSADAEQAPLVTAPEVREAVHQEAVAPAVERDVQPAHYVDMPAAKVAAPSAAERVTPIERADAAPHQDAPTTAEPEAVPVDVQEPSAELVDNAETVEIEQVAAKLSMEDVIAKATASKNYTVVLDGDDFKFISGEIEGEYQFDFDDGSSIYIIGVDNLKQLDLS